MKKTTKEQWTFGLALFGAVLSVLNAGFSLYQFHYAERQKLTTAAIEVSRNYLKDRDESAAAIALAVYMGDRTEITDNELRSLAVQGGALEYVAFLALNDKIDRAFLAMALICDAAWTSHALQKFRDRFATRPTQSLLIRFAKEAPCVTDYVRPLPQSR